MVVLGTHRGGSFGTHRGGSLLCDVLKQQNDVCWAISSIRHLTAICRKFGLIGPTESLSIQYAINTIAKHFKTPTGAIKGMDSVLLLMVEDGIVMEDVVPLTYALNETNPESEMVVKKIKVEDLIIHDRKGEDLFQFESELWSHLENHPVCAGVHMYNSFREFDFGKGAIYSPSFEEVAKFDQSDVGPGYHAMLLSGAYEKDGSKNWEFQGSYGKGWGVDGFCNVLMFSDCIGYFVEIKNPYIVLEPLTVKKPRLELFDHLISFKILYKSYIEANKAHATMLNHKLLLSDKDTSLVLSTLDRMKGAIVVDRFPPKTDMDDVRGNIDGYLYEVIKDVAKSFDVGRYNPELISTTYKLWCRAAIDFILSKLKELRLVLLRLAANNIGLVVPISCSTTPQVTRRVMLSHVLLTFVEQVERDAVSYSNCRERHNFCPLGAGYMCASELSSDCSIITAKALNFSDTMSNSIDAISDRSFVLEFLQVNTNMVTHLSALKDMWARWISPDLGFVTQQNSDSIALHKSYFAQVISSQNAAQILCGGLPFGFSQDFGQFKEHICSSAKSTISIIDVCFTSLKDATFCPDKIKKHIPDSIHKLDSGMFAGETCVINQLQRWDDKLTEE